ncbi:pyruvate kinase [Thermaurantimonas aggregans]|uniref:Pyruvate kinase n=1 Tax=Thermaurantimonas aggregans TaxID=2173829 RepID=A0A401XI71_9FLAO|nr:pyruvate kinase [Thermaurantimonas aggregans]MCX8149319.1 pyruvate kinase [Thermaurantimonas aggregans]GCD76716.1 pyruvate kinase [Thermaurantimonas aggregans]
MKTIKDLVDFLIHLEKKFTQSEIKMQELMLHPNYDVSAKNLAKYLVLRSHELRPIQNQLHHLGLSSLAASESHTHYQLLNVLKWLAPEYKGKACTLSDDVGREMISQRTRKLFGEKHADHNIPYLMVTIDERKAGDVKYFEKLLINGMNIARINFAHADELTVNQIVNTLQTAIINTGLPCKIHMDLAGPKLRTLIPNKKKKIELQLNDVIYLQATTTNENFPKKTILISETRVFETLQSGHRIYFDDGKFHGIVEEVKNQTAVIRIVKTPLNNAVLKQDKGINLPDTHLNTQSLTAEDIKNLKMIASYADLIGYSFVRKTEDIQLLRTYLKEFGIHKPVIYKIETSEAVDSFVELLYEAMKDPLFGIMIARGDSAIEIGFERLAEIQEELLWLCEAAHTPVIWATQVLESLNKTGLITRSEISDAVMASMSECVMLNKGKNIVQTMQTLKDILRRESSHREKKRFTMRPLGIVKKFVSEHLNDSQSEGSIMKLPSDV